LQNHLLKKKKKSIHFISDMMSQQLYM